MRNAGNTATTLIEEPANWIGRLAPTDLRSLYWYNLISSSETADGVRTPRSVNMSEI